ncbi:MAG TPA: UDP-N-acetylmuramate dehydrogenase [Candidatus Paceibacterota bacterium]
MKIEENKILKDFTTFRIGGPASFFCIIKSEEELLEAISFAKQKKLSIFILGGGSNILVSDDGYSGLVIKMEIMGIEYIEDENGNTKVIVGAGEDWDSLADKTVNRGLYGLENLSYIPGTVGASPVQNIGAYGSEVKDTIDTVRVYDIQEEKFINFSNLDCQFEYRDSIFKKNKNRYVITSVSFILKKEAKLNIEYKDVKEYFSNKGVTHPNLKEVREAIVYIRKNKLPDVKKVGTAGSFFKNPTVAYSFAHELKQKYKDLPVYNIDDRHAKISLAWVIDHVCGYKGVYRGDVGTYKNQALVLVNNGNAKASEIISFANEIKKIVKEKINLDIEAEVQIV